MPLPPGYAKVGHFFVDSGQIMVIDPCYVHDDLFNLNGPPTHGAYDSICRITSGLNHGQYNGGFVTSTYYGDGEYPVYAEMQNGRITKIIIDFMDSYNDDDEYEEDEEDWDEDLEEEEG